MFLRVHNRAQTAMIFIIEFFLNYQQNKVGISSNHYFTFVSFLVLIED